MKDSPSNYIDTDGYRVPIQSGVNDGGGFDVNRQLVSPNEGSSYTAGGNTLARSTRGGAATDAFDYRQSPVVGNYYYPSWGASVSTWSLLVGDMNLTFVAPMRVKIGTSFDRLRARVGNAFTGTFSFHIYSLNQDTWLPDEYLLSGGTMSWVGVGGDMENTIAFVAPVPLIGVGARYTIQVAANPAFATKPVNLSDPWPPGWNPTGGTMVTPSFKRIQSTGDPTDVSTFTLTDILSSELQKLQPLVALRRA